MFSDSLILASASPFRAELMSNAGLKFQICPAQIDERTIEDSLSEADLDGEDLANILALAKAEEVSSRNRDMFIIGSDQTLTLNGQIFHKAKTMDEAQQNLLKLSGQTHQLNSAVCLVKNSKVIWQHTSIALLEMRNLSPEFIGRYLSAVGKAAMTSVGAYQLEGPGIQLFNHIKGDYFTILGLPMLPLLDVLRKENLIDG